MVLRLASSRIRSECDNGHQSDAAQNRDNKFGLDKLNRSAAQTVATSNCWYLPSDDIFMAFAAANH